MLRLGATDEENTRSKPLVGLDGAGKKQIFSLAMNASAAISDSSLDVPVLFGSAEAQELLIRLFVKGSLRKPVGYSVPLRLIKSRLILQRSRCDEVTYALNKQHPSHGELCALLADLGGLSSKQEFHTVSSSRELRVDAKNPLGHRTSMAFRVIVSVICSGGSITHEMLRKRMRANAQSACNELVNNGVLLSDKIGVTFAERVPNSYRHFVLSVAKWLSRQDQRIASLLKPLELRPAAFVRNNDGAPRLFGTDVRLRNLMALAKHGPMYASELSLITGGQKVVLEGKDNAPFGRADLVRTWGDSHRLAAELDPAFPVVSSLRQFLLKLERRYPLPPFVEMYEHPKSPALAPWHGDKAALFGGPLATNILMTIGVLGWTFEALCVATATGYDRVVVKKALRKLEYDGIVEGQRARGPGFNVRVVRIAESFYGRDEFEALLKACVTAWPSYVDRVNAAMDRMRPRTKEHLRLRGLLKRDQWAPLESGHDLASIDIAKRKAQVVSDYRTMARNLGRAPTSNEISNRNGRVYRQILKYWGGFAAFCTENAIVPAYDNEKRREDARSNARKTLAKPAPRRRRHSRYEELHEKRRVCIERYHLLVERYGRELTSHDINAKIDSNLYRTIRANWATFAEFRLAATLPTKARISKREPNLQERERCIADYARLTAEFGDPPNATALAKSSPYLLNRIKRQWGSFADFGLEMRLPLRRHRNQHLADPVKRKRCIEEYRALSLRLGRRPGSHELQSLTDGLYKRIWRLWGGFSLFLEEVYGSEEAMTSRI